MAWRIPGFLELILPLGLFLGILLAYGRLYLESEMTVLSATGMSQQRLLGYSMVPAVIVAVVAGFLSMNLGPYGINQVYRILNEQKTVTELETLEPGRFQTMRNGSRVTYSEELSADREELRGVFISERRLNAQGQERGMSVLVAESGRQEVHADGSRYLILQNGYRYDGNPGQANYRAIQYETYGVLLPKPQLTAEVTELEAQPTLELFGKDDPKQRTELQWRLSIPVLVFVVTLLAVPLSRVNPRQGRFLKLLPAILLYMAYLSLLIAARGALDKGKIPHQLGLWWVHGIFVAIGLLLLYWEPLRLRWAARRAVGEIARG
jgi:lipopolysaccharide export system permease protein